MTLTVNGTEPRFVQAHQRSIMGLTYEKKSEAVRQASKVGGLDDLSDKETLRLPSDRIDGPLLEVDRYESDVLPPQLRRCQKELG